MVVKLEYYCNTLIKINPVVKIQKSECGVTKLAFIHSGHVYYSDSLL